MSKNELTVEYDGDVVNDAGVVTNTKNAAKNAAKKVEAAPVEAPAATASAEESASTEEAAESAMTARHDPIFDQTVKELYEDQAEKDLDAIAKHLQCSVPRVRAALKRAGVDLPKKKSVDPERAAFVRSVADMAVIERLTQTEIATRLKVKPSVVQRALAEAGLVNQLMIKRQQELLERDKQILALHNEGHQLAKIAELVGLKSLASVSNSLRRQGVDQRPPRVERAKRDERSVLLRAHQEAYYNGSEDAMRHTAVAVFLACRNISRTSQTLGLPHITTKRLLVQAGVNLKKSTERSHSTPLPKDMQELLDKAWEYLEAHDIALVDFSQDEYAPMTRLHIVNVLKGYQGEDAVGYLASTLNVSQATASRLLANANRKINVNRSRPSKYGQETLDEITRRLAAGEKRSVISQEMGLMPSTITNLIKRHSLNALKA